MDIIKRHNDIQNNKSILNSVFLVCVTLGPISVWTLWPEGGL